MSVSYDVTVCLIYLMTVVYVDVTDGVAAGGGSDVTSSGDLTSNGVHRRLRSDISFR